MKSTKSFGSYGGILTREMVSFFLVTVDGLYDIDVYVGDFIDFSMHDVRCICNMYFCTVTHHVKKKRSVFKSYWDFL